MSIYEISFSPTGGTKKVADFLANELSRDITNVDLSNGKEDFHRFSLTKEDVAVVAVPSYSGRVPSTAAERISKIQGNGAKAIIVYMGTAPMRIPWWNFRTFCNRLDFQSYRQWQPLLNIQLLIDTPRTDQTKKTTNN